MFSVRARGSISLWILLCILTLLACLPLAMEFVGRIGIAVIHKEEHLCVDYAVESGLSWGLSYCNEQGRPEKVIRKDITFSVPKEINIKVRLTPIRNNQVEILSEVSRNPYFAQKWLLITVSESDGMRKIQVEEMK